MRPPRLEAFDPKAKERTPEDVDLAGVVPLRDREESPSEPMPHQPVADSSQQSPTDTERKSARKNERSPERPEHRSEERREFRTEDRTLRRTGQLPLKRRTKRYSFEFYEDQLVKLKQLKIQAEMTGESVSLSEMVRLALDAYLCELDVTSSNR